MSVFCVPVVALRASPSSQLHRLPLESSSAGVRDLALLRLPLEDASRSRVQVWTLEVSLATPSPVTSASSERPGASWGEGFGGVIFMLDYCTAAHRPKRGHHPLLMYVGFHGPFKEQPQTRTPPPPCSPVGRAHLSLDPSPGRCRT